MFVLRNIRDKEHWAIFKRDYCGHEKGKRCYCLEFLAEVQSFSSEYSDKKLGQMLVQALNRDKKLKGQLK